jgi:urease accessory protein
MTDAASVRHQRSEGSILLSMGPQGLRRMREAHSAKVRIPFGSREAILINTGGGLAGGDRFSCDITAEDCAALTITSQAAERVYRTLGPPAEVDVTLKAGQDASLFWLPQETILFDGSGLRRRITADLETGATLLAVESIVLGREASGETLTSASLSDRWRVSQGGKLIFADDLAFTGQPPASLATLGGARAFATVLRTGDTDERLLDRLRTILGPSGAVSAWNGKLVARLAARDGFELRKSLIPALTALAGAVPMPKVWSF